MLNVRAKPSPRGKKLGEIPPNGNGIANLGCLNEMTFEEYQKASEAERGRRAHQRWCKVRYKGVVGYVKGIFLKEGSGPAQ